jgi:hypothetical protein
LAEADAGPGHTTSAGEARPQLLQPGSSVGQRRRESATATGESVSVEPGMATATDGRPPSSVARAFPGTTEQP